MSQYKRIARCLSRTSSLSQDQLEDLFDRHKRMFTRMSRFEREEIARHVSDDRWASLFDDITESGLASIVKLASGYITVTVRDNTVVDFLEVSDGWSNGTVVLSTQELIRMITNAVETLQTSKSRTNNTWSLETIYVPRGIERLDSFMSRRTVTRDGESTVIITNRNVGELFS